MMRNCGDLGKSPVMMRNCSDLGKSPVINPLFIILEIGQTYFKNAALQRKIFKVCLAIFRHFERKD